MQADCHTMYFDEIVNSVDTDQVLASSAYRCKDRFILLLTERFNLCLSWQFSKTVVSKYFVQSVHKTALTQCHSV